MSQKSLESSPEVSSEESPEPSKEPQQAPESSELAKNRNKNLSPAERFKELKRKAKAASLDNRKQLINEAKKAQQLPNSQAQASRKRLQAEIELAKLEAEENGEDFERKRAWDWTIEESEQWDAKIQQEQQRKQASVYSDVNAEAEKAYIKDRKNFAPDVEKYKKLKKEKDDDDIPDFKSRPSKESIDKLVSHLKQGDARRMKRRAGASEDDAVTYINEKNKMFNKRLSQHYDKYASEGPGI